MENYLVTRLEVSIRDQILRSINSAHERKQYLLDVVYPVICDVVLTTQKGGEAGVDGRCSGCQVRAGATIHF